MSIESPTPPSKPPSSSSKKRLLSPNYKTKQSPNTQPGPEEPHSLFSHKKTRDLPNLSDCHCCNTRINHTNPQDRLLILDSVWRIVLLCRKCIKGIQLGQNCPYCYKDCVVDECVKCSDCQRRIHRDCVVRYGDSSPWFLCRRELGLGGEGFSVCVDCWVPEVFKRSIRVVRKKKVGLGCRGGGGGIRRRVEDGVCSGGKEVVLALMAPVNGSGRNLVGRSLLRVANGDVGFGGGERIGGSDKSGSGRGLICYKRQRGGKEGDGEQRGGKCVDDVEGAGKSRCEMSESRYFPITYMTRDKKLEWRTYERGSLKRKSFLENNKDGASVEVVGTSGSCQYERGSSKRKVFLEKIKDRASVEVVGISGTCQYEKGSLKRKIFLENIKDGASTEVGINGPCLYERGSFKRKIFLDSIKNAYADVGISGTCPDSTRNTEISVTEVRKVNKLQHVDENKCTNQMECDSDVSNEGVADNEKSDRYLVKYSKKKAVHRSQLSGLGTMVEG